MPNFLKNVLAAIVAAQFGAQKLGVGMGSLMELGACTFIITYQRVILTAGLSVQPTHLPVDMITG